MNPEMIVILAVFGSYIVMEACSTGFINKQGQKPGDRIVEFFSTTSLALVIQPMVMAGGFLLGSLLFPGYAGILETWSFVAVFVLFLLLDDLTQYWWHRLSHSTAWLYKLHRPHHNAEYLSIRMVYRNNLFYYMLMPGLWMSGALIFLGGGWVYAFYIVIKMAVIFGAHSDVRWDQRLYKISWLSPIMWVIERTISTPATHSAHHGRHANDGITNYKGNYGNLLFFWDVLFNTAKITRQYPEQIGVENLPDTTVGEQLFWPLIRSEEPLMAPIKEPST